MIEQEKSDLIDSLSGALEAAKANDVIAVVEYLHNAHRSSLRWLEAIGRKNKQQK